MALKEGVQGGDPESRWVGMGAGEFIHRYVFPHGELPHISVVLSEMARAGLEVADVESLRRHYAKTCHEWASRIDANRKNAVAAASEKHFRIWQIYLAGCAFGFEHGWMNIYQLLACKEGALSLDTLPLTREYMYSR